MKKLVIFTMAFLLLSACAVGPNYVRPKVIVPQKYKEAPKGWKLAEPRDNCDRGQWWKIFHDERLNQMEAQLNITNQNIAQAAANYQQSLALVTEAKAAFYPTLSALVDITRQKQGAGSTSFVSTSGTSVSSGQVTTGASGNGSGKITTFHTVSLNAAWEIDIWGAVQRNIESAVATAESSYANIEVARLSAAATLAQEYFQLRALDRDQKILDETVKEYRKILQYTRNRYKSGVDSESDIVSAEGELESAIAAAIANGIARAQTEHAIAVLIGIPPADFSIPFLPLEGRPPEIPLEVPTALLERRPDIAAAERLMASANAQIGVAIAAFFPTLTLSGDGSYTHQGWKHWLSFKNASWSIAGEVADTILDGGLRLATVQANQAAFASDVAAYRETVLTAFQNVEDSLASLRILKKEWVAENKAYLSAKKALDIVINQYNAGTTDYNSVTIAETNTYTAEKTAADIVGQEFVSAVLLIKALGGGWDACAMCCAVST